jgi:hemerythrin-like domain-containing protein
MSIDSASAVLRGEHRLILKVVEAFENEMDEAGPGREPDFERRADCITFFRLFADACHHGKEEDLLFPELEGAGLPHDSGPIAVMLSEHRYGRSLVRLMADALEGARAGEPAAQDAFERAARAWIDLISSHIRKEDNVLFMMADHLVHGPDCARLCAAYREADGCLFEQRSKAQLEELAAKLLRVG